MRLKYICFVAFLFCFSLVCGCGSSSITNGIAGIDNSYTFTIQNAASGMSLGISGKSQNAGASIVQNAAGTATSDMFWHAIPMNSYEYNLENMLTHQLMGVSSASTSAGASVMQYADNGDSTCSPMVTTSYRMSTAGCIWKMSIQALPPLPPLHRDRAAAWKQVVLVRNGPSP